MSLRNQAYKPVQICCDHVQLRRTACKRSRERLIKYALRGYHFHFFRTLVDCTPEAPQLKEDSRTVDLENLGGISC